MTESSQDVTKKSVVSSEHPADRVGDLKTLYNVSTFEIIWRNFTAGVARAIGGITMYLLFIYVLSAIFTQIFWPRFQPFVESYTNVLETFNESSQSPSPQNQRSGQELERLLQDPEVQQLIREQLQNR